MTDRLEPKSLWLSVLTQKKWMLLVLGAFLVLVLVMIVVAGLPQIGKESGSSEEKVSAVEERLEPDDILVALPQEGKDENVVQGIAATPSSEVTGSSKSTGGAATLQKQGEKEAEEQVVEATGGSGIVGSSTSGGKCRNALHGYSLRLPEELFTNQRREEERCVLFAFADFSFPEDFAFPDHWDTELVPLIAFMENNPKEELVEELVDSLQNVQAWSFSAEREYDATAITGRFPEGDDLFGGKSAYVIYVSKDAGNTLNFAFFGEATDEQKRIFEDLVHSVKFF